MNGYLAVNYFRRKVASKGSKATLKIFLFYKQIHVVVQHGRNSEAAIRRYFMKNLL